MMKDYDEKNYNRDPGYLEYGHGIYQNYFTYILDPIKRAEIPFQKFPTDLQKNIQMINRCFYSNSLEEIIENLKSEDSAFANLCLKKMQSNSTLSMKLSLKMLQQAKNLDFKGCL